MLRKSLLCGALLLSAAAHGFSAQTYLSLSGANFVTIGQSQKIGIVTYDPQASQMISDAPYSWTSSDNNVATIDSNGNVSGLAAGTVTLTAKGGVTGLSKNYVMRVVPSQPQPLYSVTYPNMDSRSFGSMDNLAISPDGNYLYVTSAITQNNLIAPDTLETFYAPTGKYLGRAILSYSSSPGYFVPGDKQTPLAVPMRWLNRVAIINGIEQFADQVVVGKEPVMALLSPDGAYALVANYGDKTTSIVDVKNLSVVGTLPYYGAMGIHPDGQRFYIAADLTSTSDAMVRQFVLPGTTPVKSGTLGKYSASGYTVRFSADGKDCYVAAIDFDCDSLAFKSTLPAAYAPLKPGRSNTLVAEFNRQADYTNVSVSVFDAVSGKLLAVVPPAQGYGYTTMPPIAVSADQSRVYTVINGQLQAYQSLSGGQPANQDSDRVFDWLEKSYPSLMASLWQPSQSAAGYYFRYYPSTRSFLASSAGKLFYLGPATNNQLYELGAINTWLPAAAQAGY